MRLKVLLAVILIPLAVYAANTFYAEVNVKNNFTVTGNTSLGVNTSVVDLHVYRNTSLGANTSAGNFAIENAAGLTLSEADANGSNYILLKPPAAITSNITLTLPDSDGDSGQALVSDGSGGLSFTTISSSGSSTAAPVNTCTNYGFTVALASSAMTLALKNAGGSDPSANSPVNCVFRNSTTASGLPQSLSITGAVSFVISAGSSLGVENGSTADIYLYVINNSSTAILGASNAIHDTSYLVSTTAEGGAGAADSATPIYTTSAVTDKPAIPLGRITSTQATAGWYVTTPSSVATANSFERNRFAQSEIYVQVGNGYGSTSTKIRRFANVHIRKGTDITYTDSATTGAAFTVNTPGYYFVYYGDLPTTSNDHPIAITKNEVLASTQTTDAGSLTFAQGVVLQARTTNATQVAEGPASGILYLEPGDVIRAHGTTGGIASSGTTYFRMLKIGGF